MDKAHTTTTRTQGMNWIRRNSTRLATPTSGTAWHATYCGESVEGGAKLTLDHVKPHSHGGSNASGQPGDVLRIAATAAAARRPVAQFAAAVAGYINHGATATEIVAHVSKIRRRRLPRDEAKRIVDRRGSVARALAERTHRRMTDTATDSRIIVCDGTTAWMRPPLTSSPPRWSSTATP